MTYLGVTMLAIGSLGLFASLNGLASLGLGRNTVHRYRVLNLRWSFIVAVAAVPLAVLGLITGGARNISDSVGIFILADSFVVILVATVLLIASGLRSGASRTWVILRPTMMALVVGGFITLSFLASPGTALAALTGDFTSSLILIGFILPLLAAATGLLWLIVPLITRRGRVGAVTFVWSATSLTALGVVATAILAVPSQIVETDEQALLRTTFPSPSGWSPELLNMALEYARELNSTSVIVIMDGQLVAEWGKTDQRTDSHSVRKSLLSALYGIAVKEGLIDLSSTLEELGIDDENPPLSAQEKQARVVHVLQSRSGIYHDYVNPEGDLPAPGTHLPGTFLFYNNWSFNALGTIFKQQTALAIGEAFKQWIADPIGMQDFEARHVKYESSDESMHPAYRFRISARDLTRFGVLYQQEGQWNGQQIIPPDWIRESIEPYSISNQFGYGYSWWRIIGHPAWLGNGAYLASGTGGQKLLIDPSQELVVVHRADTGNNLTRPLRIRYSSVNNDQFLELARLLIAASPEE